MGRAGCAGRCVGLWPAQPALLGQTIGQERLGQER